MIVCQFNLSSTQIQVLVTFREAKDTATVERHGLQDVDHTVSTLRKLCKDGYLEWHAADKAKRLNPGYKITSKGEMMLRVIEDELRRNLKWFEGEAVPQSTIQGADHGVVTGTMEVTRKGTYRRKKTG